MANNLSLIAIVGMAGAGKSLAADFFRSKNIPILRFGDQTDIGLKEAGLERNEKNERWYREKLRAELGMAAMAVKIEPRILESAKNNQLIILDGLYSWEEFIYLKEKFPHLKLLCIYASPEVRYSRLAVRTVRPLSREEAETRDLSELKNLNKGGPIALANYLINNESDKQAFKEELEKFYSTIS